MSDPVNVPLTDDVDRVARVLMDAWEAAEGERVSVSYVATHADMARGILESEWLAERDARVRAAALAPIQALAGDLREAAAVAAVFDPALSADAADMAQRLETALAAAGVDAAPNETTTEAKR